MTDQFGSIFIIGSTRSYQPDFILLTYLLDSFNFIWIDLFWSTISNDPDQIHLIWSTWINQQAFDFTSPDKLDLINLIWTNRFVQLDQIDLLYNWAELGRDQSKFVFPLGHHSLVPLEPEIALDWYDIDNKLSWTLHPFLWLV